MSFGNQVEITAIQVHDVHVTVEKRSPKDDNNVVIINEFLDKIRNGPDKLQEDLTSTTIVSLTGPVDIADVVLNVKSPLPLLNGQLPVLPKVDVTLDKKAGEAMDSDELVAGILRCILAPVVASSASMFQQPAGGRQ